MVAKGYSSLAQFRSEQLALERLTISLRKSQVALENYRRFTAPKEIVMLQSKVIGAEATLGYQTIRLNREVERLAHYKSMVDRCTIRGSPQRLRRLCQPFRPAPRGLRGSACA